MATPKTLYKAQAIATGGRTGIAKADTGQLDLQQDRPKEMGRKDAGTNPEKTRSRKGLRKSVGPRGITALTALSVGSKTASKLPLQAATSSKGSTFL
jgi:hypothetical protein